MFLTTDSTMYDFCLIRLKGMESLLENYIDVFADISATIDDDDQFCNFTHLMWQEFFAAVFIIFFMGMEDFKELLPLFETSHYEVVAKFTFGFCNPKSLNLIQSLGFDVVSLPERVQELNNFVGQVFILVTFFYFNFQ